MAIRRTKEFILISCALGILDDNGINIKLGSFCLELAQDGEGGVVVLVYISGEQRLGARRECEF